MTDENSKPPPPKKENLFDSKWGTTRTELKSAFTSWDKLPQDLKPQESPSEKKLQDVKELILDLKDQLKIFDN